MIFKPRDAFTALAIMLGVLAGLSAADCGRDHTPEARVLDSFHLPHAVVSSADHEAEEGIYSLTTGAFHTTIVTDHPDFRVFLQTHRGQAIVLAVREYRGVK